MNDDGLNQAFSSHPRQWRNLRYVYPVISRRSRGLSIGVNLNPDAACNFNCVYCCADRHRARPGPDIDLAVLARELHQLVADREKLFNEPEFQGIPAAFRRLNDIAFSGDGEPTIVPAFPEAIRVAADVRRGFGLDDVKLIVITNACALDRPRVAAALAALDANNGEIWAKLDAGTEAYFKQINRAATSLQRVLDSILHVARERPVVIQSLFVQLDGVGPPDAEISAYLDRLRWLRDAGARIKEVQVYTVARRTAEDFVTPVPRATLERISTGLDTLDLPNSVYL